MSATREPGKNSPGSESVVISLSDGIARYKLYIECARRSANPGWYISQLVACLREEGVSSFELARAGFEARELWSGGFGIDEIRGSGSRGVVDTSNPQVFESEVEFPELLSAIKGSF